MLSQLTPSCILQRAALQTSDSAGRRGGRCTPAWRQRAGCTARRTAVSCYGRLMPATYAEAETLDIFYVKALPDGRHGKVNSWKGEQLFLNEKETWEADWLFQLKTVEVCGHQWPIGNRPEEMLTRPSGPNWKTMIQSPDPLTASHRWAFYVSNAAMAWRVSEVDPEDDLEKLTRRVRFSEEKNQIKLLSS